MIRIKTAIAAVLFIAIGVLVATNVFIIDEGDRGIVL
jgi:regulator of protease activity HflC (stomatin/prohibitin superfamily)